MPQIYYRVVCRIYIHKTWRNFSIKVLILMIIRIHHLIMSLGSMSLLLAMVLGGERILLVPRNPAAIKNISLLSGIISWCCPLYVTASVVFDYVPRGLSWTSPHSWYQQESECANGSSRLYKEGYLLALYVMLSLSWEFLELVVHENTVNE